MIIPCAFDELRGIIRYHGAGHKPAAAGLAFIDADKTMVDYVGPRSCELVVACAIGILAHYVLPCKGKHGRQLCVGSVTSRTVVNEELVALGLPRDCLTPGAVVAMQVITLDSEGGGVYCSAEENPEIFERFCSEGGRVIIYSEVGEVWSVVFKMYYNLDRIQSSAGCVISGEGNGTIEAEKATDDHDASRDSTSSGHAST
ncbi:hypothetical protein FOZ63_030755 [Perkinsus olseni]|uniref:Uncharacterized protein n=1 Tax=Perkinsus olseni TaxID=32597 RepID=A0A7J6TVI1_PEROL|nr:hypothetical protein FOZ62_005548 [Perkinsus olseni]KAF4754231.1 hypothetical protein FOZ63_030755 [Perkinsus olseni]